MNAATRAVIERLVEAQAQSSAIIADAQAILTRYLVPDGITHEQAIHELLGLLDGPVQRDAKLSTSDAIAEASKLLEGDALAQPAQQAGFVSVPVDSVVFARDDVLIAAQQLQATLDRVRPHLDVLGIVFTENLIAWLAAATKGDVK